MEPTEIGQAGSALDDKVAIEAIKHAIADAQAVLKAFDTKAQVTAAVLTFSIGMLLTRPASLQLAPWLVLTCFSLLTLSLVLCGAVIFPRRPSAGVPGSYEPMNTYHLSNETMAAPMDDLIRRVRATDWFAELVYELRKVSEIAARKAFWYRLAISTTGISLISFYVLVALTVD